MQCVAGSKRSGVAATQTLYKIKHPRAGLVSFGAGMSCGQMSGMCQMGSTSVSSQIIAIPAR